MGSLTIRTERSTNDAIITRLVRIYLDTVWRDYIQMNAHYRMPFSSNVRIRIRFSVWLISGHARRTRTHICTTFHCHCHTATATHLETVGSATWGRQRLSLTHRGRRCPPTATRHQPRGHQSRVQCILVAFQDVRQLRVNGAEAWRHTRNIELLSTSTENRITSLHTTKILTVCANCIVFHTGLPLSRQKKITDFSLTFPDEIAGNNYVGQVHIY